MLAGYRRINNKGVPERPRTKWMVLKTISSTLKFQYFRKVDFPMPCKTESRESSTESLRMVRALPPDTPRPHQFHLKYWKTSSCEKNSIVPVFGSFFFSQFLAASGCFGFRKMTPANICLQKKTQHPISWNFKKYMKINEISLQKNWSYMAKKLKKIWSNRGPIGPIGVQ